MTLSVLSILAVSASPVSADRTETHLYNRAVGAGAAGTGIGISCDYGCVGPTPFVTLPHVHGSARSASGQWSEIVTEVSDDLGDHPGIWLCINNNHETSCIQSCVGTIVGSQISPAGAVLFSVEMGVYTLLVENDLTVCGGSSGTIVFQMTSL